MAGKRRQREKLEGPPPAIPLEVRRQIWHVIAQTGSYSDAYRAVQVARPTFEYWFRKSAGFKKKCQEAKAVFDNRHEDPGAYEIERAKGQSAVIAKDASGYPILSVVELEKIQNDLLRRGLMIVEDREKDPNVPDEIPGKRSGLVIARKKYLPKGGGQYEAVIEHEADNALFVALFKAGESLRAMNTEGLQKQLALEAVKWFRKLVQDAEREFCQSPQECGADTVRAVVSAFVGLVFSRLPEGAG